MAEPTRRERWIARHKTALRVVMVCVAITACAAATWVAVTGPEWWVWLVAASAVPNAFSTWSWTGDAARAVAGSEGPSTSR